MRTGHRVDGGSGPVIPDDCSRSSAIVACGALIPRALQAGLVREVGAGDDQPRSRP